MISEFKRIEHEQNVLLDRLFPSDLQMSNDLQQIILDYAHPRFICRYDKEESQCWIRLGLAMTEGYLNTSDVKSVTKFYYEIRIYNENKSQVLSTVSMHLCELALHSYYKFCTEMVIQPTFKNWDELYIERLYYFKYIFLKTFCRYVFNSNDNCTYLLRYRFGGKNIVEFCDVICDDIEHLNSVDSRSSFIDTSYDNKEDAFRCIKYCQELLHQPSKRNIISCIEWALQGFKMILTEQHSKI